MVDRIHEALVFKIGRECSSKALSILIVPSWLQCEDSPSTPGQGIAGNLKAMVQIYINRVQQNKKVGCLREE
jgi:hypothetical protein